MRLLIVEDDAKLAAIVARSLRTQGHAVDLAGTGPEGRSLLATYDYDLLVLDLMLPGLSGTELLREARRRHPRLPVLILTARDATADKVQHLEAGADDYLAKPFDLAELNARIKALLRRGPIERSNQLQVADLVLDRHSQRVQRGGHAIELTAKEFALLQYLMASPGRVFSRALIIEHVWDQSFVSAANIVDVYVRYLRRKIDDPYSLKLIHTVRGMGYRIGNASGA